MAQNLRVRRVRPAAAALLAAALAVSLIPLASPAAADTDFVDIGDSAHRRAIEYIADHGVTQGCNPPANDRFCPDRPLTRGEMATFLVRAFDLNPSDSDHFQDDSSNVHRNNIDSLAREGVARGCNPPSNDRFCPNSRVTRGEMSAFLNRLLPLDKGGDRFDDTSGSVFDDDINAIARVGITAGCNPPANDRFCPDRSITRAEMATFLQRAMIIDRTGVTTTTTGGGGGGGGGGGESEPPDSLPNACSDLSNVPNGPSNPQGFVIHPGENIQSKVNSRPAGTTFVIASGVHHNQTISPRTGDRFIGQPGAILDGGGSTEYAIGGPGKDVLIEGLEIRNYASPVGKGVIRSVGGAQKWTIRANEIHHNLGQGINLVQGFKIIGNYIHHNQEYGIGGGHGSNMVVEGNRISHNNEYGSQVNPGVGAGGMKVANTVGLIVRDNCSHNNDGPGLWTDGGNIDTLYEGNTLVDNKHPGIKHEVSCRATIRDNLLIGNGFSQTAWVDGAGILVLNSRDVTITGNLVRGNNDGIGAVWYPRQNQAHRNCQWELKNLNVVGNRIEMDRGETGIARGNAGNEVYNSWNNRFHDNEYVLDPSNGNFFRWGDHPINYNAWLATGNS